MPLNVVTYSGVQPPRRAIYCVSPQDTQWDAAHLAATVVAGTLLKTPVILPDDCDVRAMGLMRTIFHAPGIFSPMGRLDLNPDDPYLPAETVVHELVHYFQRSRMGPVGYFATFVWQLLLAVARKGTHWHDVHLMECEARVVAHVICGGVTDPFLPIDAPLHIAAYFAGKP